MNYKAYEMTKQFGSPESSTVVKFMDDKNRDIIVVRNVHKTYLLGTEGVTALRGVSVNIKEREFVCVYGTSGGGKTTLLNIMGTIDKPTKGEVLICGNKIKMNTEDKILAALRLSYIGFVFQTFNLIGSLTALENVELPMILKGSLTKKEIRERALKLLNDVGLGGRTNHFPNQLSGGEQQRVTIARALSNEPKILLLDEPTGDLDTKNTDLVMKILLDLNIEHGITMIMVTHDVALKNYANRVIRLVDGKINKVEEIPSQDRTTAIENLRQILIGTLEEKKNPDQLGVREGVIQHDALEMKSDDVNKMHSKTEVRKPSQYPALRSQLRSEEIHD